MAKQASVRDILESVSAEVKQSEVLQGILDEPSDDETKVPEGQQPSQSQAVVVAAGVSLRVDPDDDSVAPGGLIEARPVGEVANRSSRGSPPPQRLSEEEGSWDGYSPTDPECSGSDKESDDQHHRRKSSSSKSASSDKPEAASSRIPRKPKHKLPKQTKPVSPKPKPVKAKLTAEQHRARAAERDAVKAKRDDRESQIWHDRNCCKICGSASHRWQQCSVQSCVYCHSTEHSKVSWIDFETITCPKLIARNKKLDESDRKWSEAQARRRSRDHLNYHIEWSNELDRVLLRRHAPSERQTLQQAAVRRSVLRSQLASKPTGPVV